MKKLFRPLDRYVFLEFWKIFITTALGFPLLLVVIDLTDNLSKYLARHLPRQNIFLSYFYWLPDSMFMVLPAAVKINRGGAPRPSDTTPSRSMRRG